MEKTEAAYLADEHFRNLHVWATFIPIRKPKYKIHRGLGLACSALGVASSYRGQDQSGKSIHQMHSGNKLFYLTEHDGFVEFSLPSKWSGSLTEHMKQIVEPELASMLENDNGKD